MFSMVDLLIAAGSEDQVNALDLRLAEVTFNGAAIDSRLVQPGELFVALIGERSDAHDYVDAAFDRGATAALVRRASLESLKRSPNRSIVVLDGTLEIDQSSQILVPTDHPLEHAASAGIEPPRQVRSAGGGHQWQCGQDLDQRGNICRGGTALQYAQDASLLQ